MLFPENSSSPVRPRHVELRDIDVTTDNNRPPTPHPVKSHQKITVNPSPRNRPPTPPSETSGSPRSLDPVEYSNKCCEAFIITTVCSGLIFISFIAGTAAYNYFYYVE